MAERDRTNLFLSFRSTYSHHPRKRPRFAPPPQDESRRGLLSHRDAYHADDDDAFSQHSGDAVIEMDLLPPRWADVGDEVRELLGDVARKSAKLDRLHQKHVLPGFDDNRAAEEGEIERLTAEITGLFHQCQNRIRTVDRMVKLAPPGSVSRAEEAMARNIQVCLAAKVQDASTAFRKKQSAYLKKLRGLSGITTPLDRAASPSPYGGANAYDADPSADVSFSQSALQQSATLTSNDAAIMQREREITDIARGIIELADIFKELQTMVIDQGTLLDRIDYNVERMSVNLKQADKEMDTASGYQRKTTKRKIMFLLLLLIIGLIVVLAVKPKHSASSAPSPPAIPPAQPPAEQPPGPNLASDAEAAEEAAEEAREAVEAAAEKAREAAEEAREAVEAAAEKAREAAEAAGAKRLEKRETRPPPVRLRARRRRGLAERLLGL